MVSFRYTCDLSCRFCSFFYPNDYSLLTDLRFLYATCAFFLFLTFIFNGMANLRMGWVLGMELRFNTTSIHCNI